MNIIINSTATIAAAVSLWFSHNIQAQNTKSPTINIGKEDILVDRLPWKIARTRHSGQGTAITPTIKITQKKIVVTDMSAGGFDAQIHGLLLIGPKKYLLSKYGEHEVEPGEYKFTVTGWMTSTNAASTGTLSGTIRYR
jgi:hypothetical protein